MPSISFFSFLSLFLLVSKLNRKYCSSKWYSVPRSDKFKLCIVLSLKYSKKASTVKEKLLHLNLKTLQGLSSTCAKNPVPKFTKNMKYSLVLSRGFNAPCLPDFGNLIRLLVPIVLPLFKANFCLSRNFTQACKPPENIQFNYFMVYIPIIKKPVRFYNTNELTGFNVIGIWSISIFPK